MACHGKSNIGRKESKHKIVSTSTSTLNLGNFPISCIIAGYFDEDESRQRIFTVGSVHRQHEVLRRLRRRGDERKKSKRSLSKATFEFSAVFFCQDWIQRYSSVY